jgi:hypothetical protein
MAMGESCGRKGALGAILALTGVLTVGPAGLADLSDVVLTVQASNGRSVGVLQITQEAGAWVGENFFWATHEPLPIRDADNNILGWFGPADIRFYADPQVYLGFSVQAEDTDTDFTITSALLSFPTIANAQAHADAAVTVMDFYGTGATLTGLGPTGGAYLAQYNGFVPGGTTFVERIPLIQVVPPDTLATSDFEYPGGGAYVPIGSASDMSAEFSFRLTAWGFASGSSNFEIIPEPSAALLLLAAGLLGRRR